LVFHNLYSNTGKITFTKTQYTEPPFHKRGRYHPINVSKKRIYTIFPQFVEIKVKCDMGGYRLCLLDVPRLDGDASQVNVTRRKTMALLAYLAVTGIAHSRDVLATLLWPEFDQSNALANLRRELSRIRDSLGTQALTADRQRVALSGEANLWLDVVAFKSKLKETFNHPHPIDRICQQCQETLRNAIAMYHSDFMTGFSVADAPGFDEWQFFQREEMRRLLGEALLSLVNSHVAQGEYSLAIPYARRWLSLDSMHEPAHRWLMKLFAWSGQQSAALRQYQECQRILRENIGVEPEQETLELLRAIKKHRSFPPAAERSRSTMVNETAIQPGIEQEVDAKVLPAGQDTVADRNRLSQSIRFCSSPDGVRLAYAVVGEGPVMVKTANWLSHLEYDWNSPVWRHWMTELASR
jgi:DNA-binding SARP family transcriptional activator